VYIVQRSGSHFALSSQQCVIFEQKSFVYIVYSYIKDSVRTSQKNGVCICYITHVVVQHIVVFMCVAVKNVNIKLRCLRSFSFCMVHLQLSLPVM